ncbi:MAG TPA: MEDS domain-containing protein [Pseudonocardiaceae bacterium]|nr:MEDS domain-containing protein [Pseudonocardiaceae bacterium]
MALLHEELRHEELGDEEYGVTHTLELGIPGLQLTEGDHICAFYRGPGERDEILIPYLRAGLQTGDKCICVVDAVDPRQVLAALGSESDVDRWIGDTQLELRASTDAYLRSGRFCTEEMLAFWENFVGSAVVGRFRFARSVGEMTWALRQVPGVEELVGYESELNRFLPRYPQVILCLYDLERFSGEIIIDLLKTHPRVLLGSMVLDNPNYLEPDEFLAVRSRTMNATRP